MKTDLKQAVLTEFKKQHGTLPSRLVRAPGRVNLIGEHTDYNAGFVMPMAINRASWIALNPRSDKKVRLYSIEYDAFSEFDLGSFQKGEPGWVEYAKGVAWALQDSGLELNGFEGVISCDVPMGAV